MPPMPAARASARVSSSRTSASRWISSRVMMSKAMVSSASPARIAVASSIGLVQGRPAAAQVGVVHRRQVVMDQRIAVDAFQRCAGEQRGVARHAEHGRALDHQKRAQPLAAAEARIAHGVDQPLRPRDLVGQERVGQQLGQQRFGVLGGLVEALGEVGRWQYRSSLRMAPESNSAGQSFMAAASSIPRRRQCARLSGCRNGLETA